MIYDRYGYWVWKIFKNFNIGMVWVKVILEKVGTDKVYGNILLSILVRVPVWVNKNPKF